MPTLPPAPARPALASRKQNIACDQCRSKKVRCLRASKQKVCEQCQNKGAECTSVYIDSLAQAKAKKLRKSPNVDGDEEDTNQSVTDGVTDKKRRKSSGRVGASASASAKGDERSRSGTHSAAPGFTLGESSGSGTSSQHEGVGAGRQDSIDSLHMLAQLAPAQIRTSFFPSPMSMDMPTPSRSLVNLTPSEKQQNLIQYLFAPYPITSLEYGFTDMSSIRACHERHDDLFEEAGGKLWSISPSEAHLRLAHDEELARELTEDLFETFFAIVQPRTPVIKPEDIRARFASSDTLTDPPLPVALLAVILAWGARFSEHPSIVADRRETRHSLVDGQRDKPTTGRLVSLIIVRAREVVEACGVMRIPSLENAQTLIYAEPLFGQVLYLPPGRYQKPYLSAAIDHLISLEYNTPPGLATIADEDLRSRTGVLCRLLILTDGQVSLLHQLKPSLQNDDYDCDLESVESRLASHGAADGGPRPTSEMTIWFMACQNMASICRSLCSILWIPRTAISGIPLRGIRDFIHSISLWRDEHLASMGAPTKWPDSWDFQRAITSCSIDCHYHALWLVLNRAIEKFGIAEDRAGPGGGGVEVDSVRRRAREEGEHAALRVAALTGVLMENGYLKLDPLIIHQPIYEAGLYLSARGREEYQVCAAGLRQYSQTFPALWNQADELERVYGITTGTAARPPSSIAGMFVSGTSAGTSVSTSHSNSSQPSLVGTPADLRRDHSRSSSGIFHPSRTQYNKQGSESLASLNAASLVSSSMGGSVGGYTPADFESSTGSGTQSQTRSAPTSSAPTGDALNTPDARYLRPLHGLEGGQAGWMSHDPDR
ncbi:hypothetical protein IAU60_002406 [Kwoniella sp. DSM 27419]